MKRKPLVVTILAIGSAIIILGAIVYVAAQPAADASSGLDSKMRSLIRAQVTVTDDATGQSVTTSATDANGDAMPASIGYEPLSTWRAMAFGFTSVPVPLREIGASPGDCGAPYTYNARTQTCDPPPCASGTTWNSQTSRCEAPPPTGSIPTKTITYAILHDIQAQHIAGALEVWVNMTTDNPDPALTGQSLHYVLNPDNSTKFLDGCQACLLKSPSGKAANFRWANVPVRCYAILPNGKPACPTPRTLSGTKFTVTVSVQGIDDQGRDVWGRASAPYQLVLGAGSLDVQIHASPLSIMGLGYAPAGDARIWRDLLQPTTG